MSNKVVALVAGACLFVSTPLAATAEQTVAHARSRIPEISAERGEVLDRAFRELIEEHGVITAGVGVIRNAELVWTGYYGEQRPGVSASGTTQFDVASVTKTVATETILRLVDKGKIDLDEPMAKYWLEEDIADDARSAEITPRMALTHSTGFPNWRFIDENDSWRFNPDLPLRFLFDPGTSYGYSGEGFEYVARFVERKLNKSFESLVIDEVFAPVGIVAASLSRREANFENIVRAIDSEGRFNGHYCRPGGAACRAEGEWSAADDLRIAVPDHARLMIAVMNGSGYSDRISADRDRVQVEKWNEPDSVLVLCEHLPAEKCPTRQGYGLGWNVAEYRDYKILSHGGSDFSEAAQTYFYTDSKDGILIFLNAPNEKAIAMMPYAIELLDPGSAITPRYTYW